MEKQKSKHTKLFMKTKKTEKKRQPNKTAYSFKKLENSILNINRLHLGLACLLHLPSSSINIGTTSSFHLNRHWVATVVVISTVTPLIKSKKIIYIWIQSRYVTGNYIRLTLSTNSGGGTLAEYVGDSEGLMIRCEIVWTHFHL